MSSSVRASHLLLMYAGSARSTATRSKAEAAQQIEEIKTKICEGAAFLPDCEQNLRLEMIPQDMRNWTHIPLEAECVDWASVVNPARTFTPGQQNQMMVLRACAIVPVMFEPTTFIRALKRDQQGNFSVVATNAFVQEPR